MNKIKSTFIAALLFISAAASAQTTANDSVLALKHYKFLDNVYVSLHVGDFIGLAENVRPREFVRPGFQRFGGGLTVGKNFSPALGVRLGGYLSGVAGVINREIVLYNRSLGYDGWGIFSYNQVSGFADVAANFTNIFHPYDESRRLNVMGYFGLGFIHRFDTDVSSVCYEIGKFQDSGDPTNPFDPGDPRSGIQGYDKLIEDKNRTFFAVRAGLGLSYILTKEIDLDLDVLIHAADDKLDGVRYDDYYDGFVSVLLGVKYHFRDHYGDHRFKYRKVAVGGDLSDLNDKINKTRRDIADARNMRNEMYKQQRILDMTVQFPIDKFFISDIQERNVEAVANYIKAHPNLNVVICGFADVETAYPEYNYKLSKRRVTSVFRMLVDKYGVDPSRLRTDYKGDVIQPYNRKNEWNRVVVFALEPVEELTN